MKGRETRQSGRWTPAFLCRGHACRSPVFPSPWEGRKRPAPFRIYGACISSVSRARLIFPQARQAKTVNSKAITTPGKTMPPNAVWELKLLMPYIRISTATIGSVPTARKAVPSPQAKPAKTAGKSCASGRCTADPWRDRCSGPAVRFA